MLKGGEHQARGSGLLWKDGDSRFEVESVAFKNGPNVVTFQVVTGDCRYYVVGVYIPPNCHLGVDEIWAALEACPAGCTPIVLGDLNANVGFPRDEREETIVDLLDKYNVTDLSRRFMLQAPRRFGGHVRFTWSRKWGRGREGTRHYSTPDYFMVQGDGQSKVKGVGFRFPRFLHSDHRAIVADIRVGSRGKLKEYRRKRQKFPLSLATGPQDEDTTTFTTLAAECMEPKSKRQKGKDWVSKGTWKLIT